MNDRLRSVTSAPLPSHADAIADGLEQMAQDIRAGKLRFLPTRCAVIMSGRAGEHDDFVFGFYGAETGTAQVVGMLELAKFNVIDDA